MDELLDWHKIFAQEVFFWVAFFALTLRGGEVALRDATAELGGGDDIRVWDMVSPARAAGDRPPGYHVGFACP